MNPGDLLKLKRPTILIWSKEFISIAFNRDSVSAIIYVGPTKKIWKDTTYHWVLCFFKRQEIIRCGWICVDYFE